MFASQWRKEASGRLYSKFNTLDPFRGSKLTDCGKGLNPKEVVFRDLQDIRRSRVVLAEMMKPDHLYIGTIMEIREAYTLGIPVVLWTDRYAIEGHFWMDFHCVKAFSKLDQACDYINEFFGE